MKTTGDENRINWVNSIDQILHKYLERKNLEVEKYFQ